MTNFYTATGNELQIPLMKGISDELMQVNTRDDRKRWWEVIDLSLIHIQMCIRDRYNWDEHPEHFILADTTKPVDFGEGKKSIYAYEGTEILVQREKEVQMAVNGFGAGRSVYISGLPYSFENSRILYRSILWSTHSEDELHQWYSTNFNVEVHAYVKNGKFCVVNNTYEPQNTVIYRGDGSSFALKMEANEIKWYAV